MKYEIPKQQGKMGSIRWLARWLSIRNLYMSAVGLKAGNRSQTTETCHPTIALSAQAAVLYPSYTTAD